MDRAPEGLFRWRVDGIPGMREDFSRMEAEFCAQVQALDAGGGEQNIRHKGDAEAVFHKRQELRGGRRLNIRRIAQPMAAEQALIEVKRARAAPQGDERQGRDLPEGQPAENPQAHQASQRFFQAV